MNESDQNLDLTPEEVDLARRLRVGNHPSPDLLRAAAENVLPDDIEKQVRKHVSDCEVCSVLQPDLSQLEPREPTADQRRRIRERLPSANSGGAKEGHFGRRRLLLAVGVAACILAAGISAKWLWRPASAQLPSRPRPASPALFPPITVAKAPIEIPAAMLPTRGARNPDTPSLQAWTFALKPYQDGDYARAVRELENVTGKYPRFADGYFYLGVSQLMLQRNEDGVLNLEAARRLASSKRRLQVQWYLGAAYARLGHTAEALKEWHSVCVAGSVDAKEACEAVQKIKTPVQP